MFHVLCNLRNYHLWMSLDKLLLNQFLRYLINFEAPETLQLKEHSLVDDSQMEVGLLHFTVIPEHCSSSTHFYLQL